MERLAPPCLLLAAALAAGGCADAHFLRKTCPPPANLTAAADRPAPAVDYRVGCPDVLEITFRGRPEWDAIASVDLDGRLPLDDAGRPRVEGLTLIEARSAVAAEAGLTADAVDVRLSAPRSGRVFVHGPIRGRLRIVPYQGPEPVIDFLKRVGGLPPGSRLSRVYVVRPHVAAGGRPEVFHIDPEAVLEDADGRSNIPLMPSDEVYVGESRQSTLARVLPDWARPTYTRLLGLLPDDWWPFRRRLELRPESPAPPTGGGTTNPTRATG